MKPIAFLFVLFGALPFNPLFAQKYTVSEWGVVPEADLRMTVCALDSTATAMVLQDVGRIKLAFNEHGFELTYNRSRRIKIFNPSAFDEGNLRIYYRSNRQEEKFEDLDIQVILPDGTRKKVKSDNVFTEKVNDRFNAKKVFVPNLQKGCVIEYRYKLRSADLFNLYDWYFQEDIPVRWSQVEVSLPENSDYSVLARKPKEYDLFETRVEKPEFFSSVANNHRISTYGFSDLPALKDDEPFITTVDDYRAHLWFQRDLGMRISTDTTGWQSIAITLALTEAFGRQYLDSLTNLKLWQAFQQTMETDSITDTLALPGKVMRFVGKSIKWDGTFERISEDGVDLAFTKGSGTSAEVNLAVVSLLRRFGLRAYPVLLSTRNNGEPIVSFPYFKQFNTVVAFAIIGKDSFLLDATNPYYAVNQLNGNCYNKKGWVVRLAEPFWADIRAPEESIIWLGELALDESGTTTGKFDIGVTGEAASYWRQKIEESVNKGDFLKKEFAPNYPETTLDSIAFLNLNDCEKPLLIRFKCRIPNTANAINDFLYVRPVIDFLVQKNPFTSLTRRFPVSFAAPLKSHYVLNLKLPVGYIVEEFPEKARIVLPENGGRIQFSCSKTDNQQVQVILKMNVSKLEFPPEDYGIIRQFFDLAAEKTQLQLVLKKG